MQRAARHIFMSSCTVASVNLRPMRRFVSYTVFSGLSAACVLAASPTSRSVSVNATYDGVTRLPWSLTMISTLPAWEGRVTGEEVVKRVGGGEGGGGGVGGGG